MAFTSIAERMAQIADADAEKALFDEACKSWLVDILSNSAPASRYIMAILMTGGTVGAAEWEKAVGVVRNQIRGEG